MVRGRSSSSTTQNGRPELHSLVLDFRIVDAPGEITIMVMQYLPRTGIIPALGIEIPTLTVLICGIVLIMKFSETKMLAS